MMNCIRLPLEGAPNVRDLGGIYTRDNQITKFHTFIRGSKLTYLTLKDNEFLKKYNVTDIIDLRGRTQIQHEFVSDDNIDKEYFHFYYVPIANELMENYTIQNINKPEFNLGEAYYLALENESKRYLKF